MKNKMEPKISVRIRWLRMDISNWKIRHMNRLNQYIQKKLYVEEVRRVAGNASSDIQEIQMVLKPLMEEYIQKHNLRESRLVNEGRRWIVASHDDYRLDRNLDTKFYEMKEYMK